jgi:hypothetical protein
MHTTPHQTAAPRRSGYQNAMLTAIAVLLAVGVVDRHAGSGDRLDRLMTPDAAQAQQPQTDGGLANKLDQNKQIIAELRSLNGKMDRIEAKLNSGLSVKVTDMPPLRLPPEVKGKGEKGDAKPDAKPDPKVDVKPGK